MPEMPYPQLPLLRTILCRTNPFTLTEMTKKEVKCDHPVVCKKCATILKGIHFGGQPSKPQAPEKCSMCYAGVCSMHAGHVYKNGVHQPDCICTAPSKEFHSLALGFRKFFDDREEFVNDTVCGHLAIEIMTLLQQARTRALEEAAEVVKHHFTNCAENCNPNGEPFNIICCEDIDQKILDLKQSK